jgi:hypothetical protein
MPTAVLHRLPAILSPAKPGTALAYFGPAMVTAVLDRDVELETPETTRSWARVAVAQIYQPQAGDVVLMLSTAEAAYVVGVLEGHGPSVLHVAGDLELMALHGEIRITAGKGCVVATPEMRVQAENLDLIGGTLHEQFDTVRRRISGAIDERARTISTTVAETWRLVARRIAGRGGESVTIDAPSINLG